MSSASTRTFQFAKDTSVNSLDTTGSSRADLSSSNYNALAGTETGPTLPLGFASRLQFEVLNRGPCATITDMRKCAGVYLFAASALLLAAGPSYGPPLKAHTLQFA